MNRFIRAGILCGVSALFISCDLLPRKTIDPDTLPILAPARNEFYVFGTDRLTLNEFETLRLEYPKVSPADLVRLALESQILARSWRAHGDGNALREATRCVRVRFAPEVKPEEKKEAAALLARSFGLESWEALETHLSKARQKQPIQWNPDLAREYGLQAQP
jgi:hypothetical protein